MPSYDAFAPHFDAWQHAFGGAYDTLILPRLLAAIARHAPGARRVVDLGIGTGDLVLALARRGFAVIGVDVSEPMLAVARAKLDAAGLDRPPVLVRDDLRAVALPAPVDVAICVYTVLNQLTGDDDLVRACRAVASNLAAGGLFLFELNLPESYARYWSGTEVMTLADGTTVRREHRADAGRSVIVADVTIREPSGVEHHDVIEQRAWSDDDVAAALAAAGLAVVEREVYDPFSDAGPPMKALWAVRRAR